MPLRDTVRTKETMLQRSKKTSNHQSFITIACFAEDIKLVCNRKNNEL